MPQAFIGTSGWVYSHWQPKFYPQDLKQKDWLLYYAKYFDTVEINATFYHSMKPKTFKNWRKIVGPKFVFAVKASRFITHIKRLKGCQEPVKKLMNGIRALRTNPYDVVLFQLPPRWQANPARLKDFLKVLPKNFRFAFEFRDQSWLESEIYKSLKRANCALVIQDSPYWPKAEVITAEFTYLRFHGAERLYSSCYSKKELQSWAKKIKDWLKNGLDVYVYFNNDALGHAVENAATLKELVA